MPKKNQKLTRPQGIVIAVIVLIVALITGYFSWNENSGIDQPLSSYSPGKEMQVQFLDVGQADSSLIFLPNGKTMLIDAGGNATAEALVHRLKEQNIQKLDYVIGTHPHEDHIGGLDLVIDTFEIGELYLPKVDDSQVPTTKTYEDVLTAIANKGLRVNQGRAGIKILEEENLCAEILAPNSDQYRELNSYSIAVRLQYGDRSFLFMGDAESDSEQEMLERFSVASDVLKCGHHGSSTSTSWEFLQKVQPKYAVISCGQDNKYGHPHQETLESFKKMQVSVHRTDEEGSLTFYCDGTLLRLKTGGESVT